MALELLKATNTEKMIYNVHLYVQKNNKKIKILQLLIFTIDFLKFPMKKRNVTV